jgi:hypothetical protein
MNVVTNCPMFSWRDSGARIVSVSWLLVLAFAAIANNASDNPTEKRALQSCKSFKSISSIRQAYRVNFGFWARLVA